MKSGIPVFGLVVLLGCFISVAQAQTPEILAQPTNQVAVAGSAASFSVTASGAGPLTYQWQFNGTDLPNGVITTVAGKGIAGYSGDGGAATNAELLRPAAVAVDSTGSLFIADTDNSRIRRVGANGIITTVAGNGTLGYRGDGSAATNAGLEFPQGVAVDASGSLFIADTSNNRVRKVGADGIISTVAGNGTNGYSGDGGAATNTELNFPLGLATDASGNLFIADYGNARIRRVGTNGTIATVAGNGSHGYGGDGHAATDAALYDPQGVAVDASGNLFIADPNSDRVRKVDTNGIITRVAGNGSYGYGGDGGPATSARLSFPNGVAVDASGNLFIADPVNALIRQVGSNGIITTAVGNGRTGYAGDGGPSTHAELNGPEAVAVDASGNLFIADTGNQRIREVIFQRQSPALVLSNVGAANAGAYDVVISSPSGSVTSSVVTLQVMFPPAIVTQPQSQAVAAGSNAALSVTATGTAPLAYQWYFDGAPLAGQTNAAWLLSAAAFTDAGSYTVLVTNLYGSVTSAPAILDVGVPPTITTQPVSQTNLVNGTASFSVGASGTGPLTYQWQFNGVDLPSNRVQGPALVLTNVGSANVGSYDVVVSSPYGSVISRVVSLQVLFPPALVTQPQVQAVAIGSNLALSVAATGAAPLDYQWYFDGAPLPGQTNASLLLSAAGSNDAGSYKVVVTNLYGSVTSAAAVVTVGIAPAITAEPVSQTNLPNGTVTFSVTASGTGPLTYQWQFNGANLPRGLITTVAGKGTTGYSGDGGAATNAELSYPYGVAFDASGNLFIADQNNHVVRKVGTNGIITTAAGNGTPGYSGNGGVAASAELSAPSGLAVDASGNLFIADQNDNVIREVATYGIITTAAGNGTAGYAGDGGEAPNAELAAPAGVAVDASGNLFIADQENNVIREAGAYGLITTVAGDGIGRYSGDGGRAASAELYAPAGVALDASGDLFIADRDNFCVRKVTASGIITTVAGNGTPGYSGDGGAATHAELSAPLGVAVDASGNLFIADTQNNRIREVGTNGIISTVAGNGAQGYSGDGGSATDAGLSGPSGGAVDGSGNLFIADSGNQRIRKVAFLSRGPTLVLNNVAGGNAGAYDVVVSSPYGSVTSRVATLQVSPLALPVLVTQPQSQTVVVGSSVTLSAAAAGSAPLYYQWYFDGTPLRGQTNTSLLLSAAGPAAAGSYYVVVTNPYGSVTSAAAVLSLRAAPSITMQPVSQAVLPNGTATFSVAVSGPGPLSYQWQFNGANLPNRFITTAAGNGTAGYSGDGGPAGAAELNDPFGVAVDGSGNLFIADAANSCIRKVGASGIISTVAGSGIAGYSGDGGPATAAQLWFPYGVAVDGSGNLFIPDWFSCRVRKVGTNGIITTVAGNGTPGYAGDGGAAAKAQLQYPYGVAVDAPGNLFIADSSNHRIRKVGTDGIITTVAGNGTRGYSGDGRAATSAELNFPAGVAVDASGILFIADENNNCVRSVGTNGLITTAAGNGFPGYSGDGGAAASAELNLPCGVAVDATANLFIADSSNNVVREVGIDGMIATVAGNGTPGYSGDGGAPADGELNHPTGVAVDAAGNLFIADQNNNVIREVFIPGPTLVLNNVVAANAGAYDVVVSNPYGSVTSSVVTLALALPPLNALLVGRQAVQLQFQGTPGASYLLLTATDLSPPVDWRPVITNIAGPNGAWTFTDTNVPSTRTRFYRMSATGQ